MHPPTLPPRLLDPAALRLAMGELTADEVRLAQASAQMAWARLGVRQWAVVPQDPDPALLMSIAVRLDHGLGVPGYYDQLAQLLSDRPIPTHAQRLESTLALARRAHAAMVAQAAATPIPEILVEAIQDDLVVALVALCGSTGNQAMDGLEAAGIARAAGRYALTHLARHGMVAIPQDPDAGMIQAVAQILEAQAQEEGLPAGLTAGQMRPAWQADASRIHEEAVGTGFYRPEAPRATAVRRLP